MSAPPPPPRRTASPSLSSTSTSSPAPGADESGWKGKMKARGAVWGKKAMDKGQVWSDNIGGKVNTIAQDKFGAEAFWPTTGDLPKEMEKAARILRAFTETGVMTEQSKTDGTSTPDSSATPGKKPARKVKILRKIPPQVIAQAKGLAIFSAFRSGIAPLGGAGGAGIVIARLEDGSWSAPASISPNNLAGGFLLGMDMYDAVLVLRTPAAVASFKTHKVTLGAEIGVAAGPYGAGFSGEAGLEKAPIFSYVKSRGMYAGIEAVGQVFVERFDENAAFYHWPGIKGGDILAGKVKPPKEAAGLYAALADAESGRAQAQTQDGKLDAVVSNDTELELREGEVLNLPPTPDQTDGSEAALPSSQTSRRAPPLPPTIPARRVPPPPPPASNAAAAATVAHLERPSVGHHDSGRSEYSQPSPPPEMQATGYAPPTGPPPLGSQLPPQTEESSGLPGYDAGPTGYAADEYPVEKQTSSSEERVLAAAGVIDGPAAGVSSGLGHGHLQGQGDVPDYQDQAPGYTDGYSGGQGPSPGYDGAGYEQVPGYGHDLGHGQTSAVGSAHGTATGHQGEQVQVPGYGDAGVEDARRGLERTGI